MRGAVIQIPSDVPSDVSAQNYCNWYRWLFVMYVYVFDDKYYEHCVYTLQKLPTCHILRIQIVCVHVCQFISVVQVFFILTVLQSNVTRRRQFLKFPDLSVWKTVQCISILAGKNSSKACLSFSQKRDWQTSLFKFWITTFKTYHVLLLSWEPLIVCLPKQTVGHPFLQFLIPNRMRWLLHSKLCPKREQIICLNIIFFWLRLCYWTYLTHSLLLYFIRQNPRLLYAVIAIF